MRFLSGLDHARISKAIALAEERTSGQIRVHVTHRKPDNLEERASRRFQLLGMTQTHNRNGVLLYIAPKAHRFHILGDVGVHERCGDDFWMSTAKTIEAHFRKGEFTEGILAGIDRVGAVLAQHFPKEAGLGNELPNEVTED
jgi:uncharacterized membrane protein